MKADDSDLRARFPNSFGYLASVRKRAARIVASKADDASIPIGASKLGGLPDLPPTTGWPMVGERPMSFVAQLGLDELGAFDDDALVPHEGLLLFFLDVDTAGSIEGKVIRAPGEVDKVKRTPMPRSPIEGRLYAACSVSLTSIESFPRAPSPFIDEGAIHKKERAGYSTLLHDVDGVAGPSGGPLHQALGYIASGDEANAQDGDTRLLLQLDADPSPGFDFGTVAFLGQDADLRRGEVARVRVIRLAK